MLKGMRDEKNLCHIVDGPLERRLCKYPDDLSNRFTCAPINPPTAIPATTTPVAAKPIAAQARANEVWQYLVKE